MGKVTQTKQQACAFCILHFDLRAERGNLIVEITADGCHGKQRNDLGLAMWVPICMSTHTARLKDSLGEKWLKVQLFVPPLFLSSYTDRGRSRSVPVCSYCRGRMSCCLFRPLCLAPPLKVRRHSSIRRRPHS